MLFSPVGISASSIGFASFQLKARLLSPKASPEEVTGLSADVRTGVSRLVELKHSVQENFPDAATA